MSEQARPFWLIRDDTIVVADGVKFPDGTAVIRWRQTKTLKATTAIHPDLGSIVAVHGHNGHIRASWCDSGSSMTKEETEEDVGFA